MVNVVVFLTQLNHWSTLGYQDLMVSKCQSKYRFQWALCVGVDVVVVVVVGCLHYCDVFTIGTHLHCACRVSKHVYSVYKLYYFCCCVHNLCT